MNENTKSVDVLAVLKSAHICVTHAYCQIDIPIGTADNYDAAIAALIAERDALQATVIRLHVARELLTNIKRACARGRNSAAPTKVNNSFIATCDHVENLANEALAAITTGESA